MAVRYIIIILLFFAFATSVQADQPWMIWQKQTNVNNGKVTNVYDWTSVGAFFTDKAVCQKYATAMLSYLSLAWGEGKGREIFFEAGTEEEDLGKLHAIIHKTVDEAGERLFVVELACQQPKVTQPNATPQPPQQRRKGGNK
jgi:hypothetical protein